jgi:hypothetical protein
MAACLECLVSNNSVPWQNLVRSVTLDPADEDLVEHIALVRKRLEARLRIMTAADAEERQALEDALVSLTVLAFEAEQRDNILKALQAVGAVPFEC